MLKLEHSKKKKKSPMLLHRACANWIWRVSSPQWEKLELCREWTGEDFPDCPWALRTQHELPSILNQPASIFLSKYQSPLRATYLDLSFDEGRDVVLILKDGERLQQVVFQPLPVLRDLFTRGSWRRGGRNDQSNWTMGHLFGCYAFTFKQVPARLSCLLRLM